MDGSITKSIEKQAEKLALKIVQTTSDTMALENQKISDKRLKKAVTDKSKQLIYEMPHYLWD